MWSPFTRAGMLSSAVTHFYPTWVVGDAVLLALSSRPRLPKLLTTKFPRFYLASYQYILYLVIIWAGPNI